MKSKSLSDLQNLLGDDERKKIADEKEKRDMQMREAKERIASLTVKEMNLAYFPAFIRWQNRTDMSNIAGITTLTKKTRSCFQEAAKTLYDP